MEAHPGAMEAHPGATEAHPGATKAHPGAIEAHPGDGGSHWSLEDHLGWSLSRSYWGMEPCSLLYVDTGGLPIDHGGSP